MIYKYNVLWLDDEPIKIMDNIRSEYQEINFEKVDYIDVCEEKIEFQSKKYHAVILDANGIKSNTPEKSPNKNGFLTLVKKVIEKRILLYIYSGQLLRATDGDTADVVMESLSNYGLHENENIFFKSGGPYQMIEKIRKDLDNKYHYYVGHEYLLDFFSNGWVENKYKTECLDPIMEYYCNKDYNSAHGNQMRNLTECMLEKINQEFKVDTTSRNGDPNRYTNIVKAIKFKKLDLSDTISGPLLHMIDITNAHSHSSMVEDERKLYFDSDFSTFFIVTYWFNKLMFSSKNVNSEDDDEPTEKDQQIKPQIHEKNRSGVAVETFQENGRTYCNIKVEIPSKYMNCKKVFITGIQPDNRRKNSDWYPYCEEIKE